MQNCYTIKSQKDIDTFIEQSNALHDGYVLSVQYLHNGIKRLDDGRLEFCPEDSELTIRIMITSIWDTVIELHFSGVLEWQMTDSEWEILGTSVSVSDNGLIVWTDGDTTDEATRRDGSYVVAKSMEYCFCEDHRQKIRSKTIYSIT